MSPSRHLSEEDIVLQLNKMRRMLYLQACNALDACIVCAVHYPTFVGPASLNKVDIYLLRSRVKLVDQPQSTCVLLEGIACLSAGVLGAR
jgi:hypothetical protein